MPEAVIVANRVPRGETPRCDRMTLAKVRRHAQARLRALPSKLSFAWQSMALPQTKLATRNTARRFGRCAGPRQLRVGAPGPVGMLRRVDEALGMRHQTEHTARGVANTGDVVDRAVGVRGVRHRLRAER